jgi:hypothetical protein
MHLSAKADKCLGCFCTLKLDKVLLSIHLHLSNVASYSSPKIQQFMSQFSTASLVFAVYNTEITQSCIDDLRHIFMVQEHLSLNLLINLFVSSCKPVAS